MIRPHLAVLLLTSVLPKTGVLAQNPGQHISVEVIPDSVVVRGDTVGIRAIVRNLSTSVDSLLTYAIDVPGGVSKILKPDPAILWDAVTSVSGRSAAAWTTGEVVAPGGATPELYFESVGLPTVQTFWAGGDYQYPSYDDGSTSDTVTVSDPLNKAMIQGKTVGVELWPSNRTAQALLARLRSLTTSACASPLLWITDGALCTALLADIDQAELKRANNQLTEARASLAHYISLLAGAQPGSPAAGVTASGYWLLRPNAEIVTGLLY